VVRILATDPEVRVRFSLYQIFWVVGLEQGPLSLVSTIEELLGRKSSGSVLESREYGRRGPSGRLRDTFYQQKLALISMTSCGRSVGIVVLGTEATELALFVCFFIPEYLWGYCGK
jgi:hypothetical protein